MNVAPGQVDHWKLIGPVVPENLEDRRVLDVGPGGEDPCSRAIRSRSAVTVASWNPSDERPAEEGVFDLVVCRDSLNATAHPANLLSDIWHLTAVDGTLLLECRVMTAVDLSIYARFVEAAVGVGEAEWLPGRLALRWSVETSGFDVDRWIDSPGLEAGSGEASAYLAATRVARPPALDISIPEPAEDE
ncbi:MAG TPA: methyltransferase domain-containing protein [Solirubrobacterales bacterium]|jgi:hypothetical protein